MFETASFIIQATAVLTGILLVPVMVFLIVQVLKGNPYE